MKKGGTLMTYRNYPLSFKLKIVQEFLLNKNAKGMQSKIAKKYGISNYSVSNWVRKYKNTVMNQEIDVKHANCMAFANNKEHSLLIENEILKSIIIKKEIELNQLRNKLG